MNNDVKADFVQRLSLDERIRKRAEECREQIDQDPETVTLDELRELEPRLDQLVKEVTTLRETEPDPDRVEALWQHTYRPRVIELVGDRVWLRDDYDPCSYRDRMLARDDAYELVMTTLESDAPAR